MLQVRKMFSGKRMEKLSEILTGRQMEKVSERKPAKEIRGETREERNERNKLRKRDAGEEFSTLISERLSYENVLSFIANLNIDIFTLGYLFIDDVFYSKFWKTLSTPERLDILNVLDICDARYSDETFVEALFCDSSEIRDWVAKNLYKQDVAVRL